MADFDVVAEKLLSFEDADSLADYFHSYGIVATPRDARSCAISRFVEVETGATDLVVTTMNGVRIMQKIDETWHEEEVAKCPNSPAMMQFIENYDQGHYPFLVEEGYDWTEIEKSDCPCCVEDD